MNATGFDIQAELFGKEVNSLEAKSMELKTHANMSREELKKAAKNFESYVMSFMYKSMYEAVPKNDVMGRSDFEGVFMNMYLEEATKNSPDVPGSLANQLVKQYEKHLGTEAQDEVGEINVSTTNVNKSVTGQLLSFVNNYRQDRAVQHVFKDFDAMIAKVEGQVSSKYGMRMHPLLKEERFHSGVDVALELGAPVKAASKGNVVFAGVQGGYGNTVVLDHGLGVSSVYAHLSEINVKQGEKINKNDLVGKVGSSGLSTGPHLHFEVRKDGKTIDPQHLSLPDK